MKTGLGTHFTEICRHQLGFGENSLFLPSVQRLPLRPYSVGCWTRSNDAAAELSADDFTSDADDEDPIVRRKRTEAVLFLSKGPLSLRKLASLAHLADATEARTLVRQLNDLYQTRGRAIRVEQIAGGYRMMTCAALAPWLTRLGHLPSAVRLSTPMLETLSVVAYRQPVSRAEVESIRGVGCGELLRQLMEKDLIRIAGRSEELGRPYLYGTTKRFLQIFGLVNIDALPPINWQLLEDEPIDGDGDDENTDAPESLLPESENLTENENQPDHRPESKESQVSIAIAPGIAEAGLSEASNPIEAFLSGPHLESGDTLTEVAPQAPSPKPQDSPAAIIEDEEDEYYGDLDDDEEDEDYPDDDDWGDDDDLDDEGLDEDDLDEDDLDDESTEWEEVDDDEDWDDESDEDDLDDEDDEEWVDDDAADDDEDWS